ncbi:hypothetical protein CK203_066269 [Vitis vinifera]|uniref:Uncharacterized protein n=1 Tax=Vitis vinifera TaxID=29760 RepID=A0A438G2J3_VITVI|nr:hypothetical protein CK203_066269 [Vitis vinifera]
MPPEVKQEIRRLIEQKNKAKAKKAVDIEEIRAELRDTMGKRHRHVIDEDDEENLGGDGGDDDDDGDDMCICIRLTCTLMSDMLIERRSSIKSC